MKYSFLLVFVCWALVLATSVVAANSCGDTNHICTIDTNISADTTWIDGNVYVLLEDINVTGSGTVLTIEPGALVKFVPNSSVYAPGAGLILTNGATIVANGTAEKKIVFTSCRDQNSYNGFDYNSTATISRCSESPVNGSRADVNVAIFVGRSSGMSKADSLSYLTIIGARDGIFLDANIGSIHDVNFVRFSGGRGITVNLASDVNLFRNSFFDFNDSSGILFRAMHTGEVYDSNFQHFAVSSSGIVALGSGGSLLVGSVYNNRFQDFASSTGIAVLMASFSRVFNNQFLFFTGTAIMINTGSSKQIVNNLFFDIRGFSAIHGSPSAVGVQRNVFAYVDTALEGSFSSTFNNAFFQVTTKGGDISNHENDVNSQTGFTVTPFIADGSDRNFLLNSNPNGGALLVNAGLVDVNAFFAAKTTQLSNELDLGRIDIGYHYDANGAYVPPEINLPGDSKIKCGNNLCETSETAVNCPIDCSAVCGDSACTHTENISTCSVDCAVGCGNKICEATEDSSSCPVDCGLTETVLSSNPLQVVSISPVDVYELKAVLFTLGILESDSLVEALQLVRVERSFFIDQIVRGGESFDRTRIRLRVQNSTSQPLKEISIIEVFPADFNMDSVSSEFPFLRIENKNAISFMIPGLLANQSVELDYLIPSAVSVNQAESFSVPFAAVVTKTSSQEVAKSQCASNADCLDDNLCTANKCIQGMCYSVVFPEGEMCDVGKVCKNMVCSSIAVQYASTDAVDPIVLVSVGIIAVILVAIGFEYFKK